jgi:hypothetical protein
MLRLAMRLLDQWRAIEEGLPAGWPDARLELTPESPERLDRAAALLAPLMPGRTAKSIRFFVARRGAGPSAEALGRALRRLDRAGIRGRLELVSSGEPTIEAAVTEAGTAQATLAASWDAEAAALPPDWSDVYAEIEFRSSDQLERAALLLAPLNPARFGGRPGFRFRAAREYGYGASPGMVRRCLERLDEEDIRGRVRVLRVLSDSRPVATQGPVWYVGGRAV